MVELVNTDSLVNDYTADRPVNYYSDEFKHILEVINIVLQKYNIEPLTYESTKVIKSKFDKGIYNNSNLWRVTGETFPELNNSKLEIDLQAAVNTEFPEYVKNGTIQIGHYFKDNKQYTTIKILPAGLKDNIFTKDDLKQYRTDTEVKARLDALEDRMFRRKDDKRSKETRYSDFDDSAIYEEKLVTADLIDITGLKLEHSTDIFTLEPDSEADFTGYVRGEYCNIEGKSTWDYYKYSGTEADKKAFAKYIDEAIKTRVGSVHKAKYLLYVFKLTGQVICVNLADLTDNWLAGSINILD